MYASLVVLVILSTLFGAHLATALDWGRDFSDTCDTISWVENYEAKVFSVLLSASCQLDGRRQDTTLDLSDCIGIDPGSGTIIKQEK